MGKEYLRQFNRFYGFIAPPECLPKFVDHRELEVHDDVKNV